MVGMKDIQDENLPRGERSGPSDVAASICPASFGEASSVREDIGLFQGSNEYKRFKTVYHKLNVSVWGRGVTKVVLMIAMLRT